MYLMIIHWYPQPLKGGREYVSKRLEIEFYDEVFLIFYTSVTVKRTCSIIFHDGKYYCSLYLTSQHKEFLNFVLLK